MEPNSSLSRRALLRAAAAGAAAAALGACQADGEAGGPATKAAKGSNAKGSVTKPLPVPGKLREAPSLAARVKAGALPPLSKRIPESPYVVPHRWQHPGKYGGTCYLTASAADDASIGQYMYGHSIVRWLNDGMEVGPGLAQSWESNDDFTRWTFHFRKGLRWSDGAPWTTADIMYWWEDTVLNPEHPEVPPEEAVSGKGTVAKITAPDDVTLVLEFDSPAALTPDRLADTVNRSVGADWLLPRHYLRQFHPKYNPKVTAKDWYVEHDNKANHLSNPDCPVTTGWHLSTYHEARNAVWERNPYYWCVDQAGNQLPFMDRMVWNAVKDQEVMKLQYTQGKADFAEGQHTNIDLADVEGLKQAAPRTGVQVWYWGSGSGSGSMFFFNYDYPDEAMRELIRKPEFRQALSHAYNRADVRKSLYYNTGELTTGTLSPKAPEFQVDAGSKKLYRSWRDSYVAYDPEKAKAILDRIGVVDKDGDGYREKPDGSKLVVRLDYPADTAKANIRKNDFLRRDWKAIGIRTEMNPVAPTSWSDMWNRGELMSNTAWEIGGGGIMSWPSWVIPTIPDTWAPLHGQAYIMRGTDPAALRKERDVSPWKRHPPWVLPEKGSPVGRLWSLYDKARLETDPLKRNRLLWDMCRVHIKDGPFFLGVVADYPQVILVHKELQNVPRRENLFLGGQINTWDIPVPAIYDPEAWFWSDPGKHS
ncbi:ABC transporter substrate-binding protein [Actinopolymorpha singaporensis]|uniref:Peptide/nickel transport system substrate-binding protein n=1 Tax=Actinopolymorpha singaporensis TaxID=117157 RepID=A0A1H1QDC4_9ACTN|nr:ABC transporter substrate-binding protein [Actinopolymorpha singaporensis]SDS21425.1 peptide/nickel transport system substrate-binding protein [Actinopolymorpha singaporensis]